MRFHWKTVPLKDLCENFKSDIVDGPFGANLKREHYKNSGTPVLKIQNIKPFEIILKKMDYVDEAKAEELKRHSYKKGDIIITKLGLPLGISAIVENIDDGIIVADLVRVRAKKVNTNYLCYHLNSPITNAFLNEQKGGSTRPRVRITAVRELPINVPPLPEQERIVSILDKAFEGIDKAIAQTEQNLASARELFESYLNNIFTQKGDGWVEDALIKVASFIDYRGRTPKKTEEGIRLLTAKNVRMGYLKRNPEEFIAEAAFDDWMTRGIPTKGDVLFTTEAPLANVTLLDTDEKIALAQRIITICPDRNILTGEYLSYCLQSKVSQDRILEKGTGATVMGIKSKLLKEIPVPIAPMDQQKSIVLQLDALLDSTNQLESHYQTKLGSLDELKQSLLQQAFAGELTKEDAA